MAEITARWWSCLPRTANTNCGAVRYSEMLPLLRSIDGLRSGAFDVLDRVDFSSAVDSESPNSARVTFFDHLRLGSEVHRYTCQQVLTTNENGRIKRIMHVDLAGEEARLEAFFEKCGAKRPRG